MCPLWHRRCNHTLIQLNFHLYSTNDGLMELCRCVESPVLIAASISGITWGWFVGDWWSLVGELSCVITGSITTILHLLELNYCYWILDQQGAVKYHDSQNHFQRLFCWSVMRYNVQIQRYNMHILQMYADEYILAQFLTVHFRLCWKCYF